MQLGDLTRSLDQLQELAAELFKAYENDDDVVDLKDRAITVRDRAQNLVEALDAINGGLAQL